MIITQIKIMTKGRATTTTTKIPTTSCNNKNTNVNDIHH